MEKWREGTFEIVSWQTNIKTNKENDFIRRREGTPCTPAAYRMRRRKLMTKNFAGEMTTDL